MMQKNSLDYNDETMSLSVSDNDNEDEESTTTTTAARLLAVESTPLVTCAAVAAAAAAPQPVLLVLPLHGDAASAAAEESGTTFLLHHHHQHASCTADDNDNDEPQSFLQVFIHSKGPPQIAILCMLLAFGFGSTVGVVPAVMADRYARLNHGYTDELDCSAYNSNHNSHNNNNSSQSHDGTVVQPAPAACLAGSLQAQNAVALEQFIANTISFFTSTLLGSWSDQQGRRHVLLVGVFLSTLTPCSLVILQLVPTMSPNYYYATSALSSGLINWVAIALSSLSDVMPSHYRASSFGLILAAFSLGFACAPNLALFLNNPLQVSILALVMIVLGFLVILLFFPETLSPQAAAQAQATRIGLQQQQEQQDAQQQQHMMSITTSRQQGHQQQWRLLLPLRRLRRVWNNNKCTLMRMIYRPIWELSILNRNRLFRLLSCLAFFNAMASSGDRTLLLYYVQEPDTGIAFTNADIAKLFLLVGLLGIFVQGLVLNHANDWLGERRLVRTCFLCGVVHNLFYAMAGSASGSSSNRSTLHAKAMIFAGAAISSLVGMAFPTISAIKANNVHASEQGRVQGALYSLQAVASAIGPFTLRGVYHFTKNGNGIRSGSLFSVGPGSMFCFASFLYAMAAYYAHLLPPEANSKRGIVVSNELAAPISAQDEEQQVPSAETPLLSR